MKIFYNDYQNRGQGVEIEVDDNVPVAKAFQEVCEDIQHFPFITAKEKERLVWQEENKLILVCRMNQNDSQESDAQRLKAYLTEKFF